MPSQKTFVYQNGHDQKTTTSYQSCRIIECKRLTIDCFPFGVSYVPKCLRQCMCFVFPQPDSLVNLCRQSREERSKMSHTIFGINDNKMRESMVIKLIKFWSTSTITLEGAESSHLLSNERYLDPRHQGSSTILSIILPCCCDEMHIKTMHLRIRVWLTSIWRTTPTLPI